MVRKLLPTSAVFLLALAAAMVWMVEANGMAIAHSSGASVLLVLCPGMIPVFIGLFSGINDYVAWAVATLLTAVCYWFVVRFFLELRAFLRKKE